MSDKFDAKRKQLIEIAKQNPRPCMVCDTKDVCGIGTWIPSQRQRLAAGGTAKRIPVFAFWLCETHVEETLENDKLIQQAIIRSLRIGK